MFFILHRAIFVSSDMRYARKEEGASHVSAARQERLGVLELKSE